MSIPPFLTAARTAFADPISTPKIIRERKAYQWQLLIPFDV
jgi:hypothetical protein